jgi:hypothetical protein
MGAHLRGELALVEGLSRLAGHSRQVRTELFIGRILFVDRYNRMCSGDFFPRQRTTAYQRPEANGRVAIFGYCLVS